MKRSFMVITVLFAVLLLASCTSFNISISSLSSGEINYKQKIFLMPGDQNIDRSDLLFIEFSKDVSLALRRNGFEVVEDIDSADQILFLVYGISDPKNQTVSIPQFGKTGVKSSTTTGSVNVWGNRANYRGTTTYNYDYGITGYNTVNRNVYTRVLLMNAYDWKAYQKNQQVRQLWQTQIVSTGSSSDLRLVFPYLALASENYIGRNTGKAINVKIYESDSRVQSYQNN